MSTPTTQPPATLDRRAIWRAGAIAAAAAAVVNVVIALVASAADVSLEVAQAGADAREELPVGLFAVASVIGAAIGIGLAQVLAGRPKARRRFVAVGVAGAVLSLIGPLTVDAESGTKALLVITHVVAAALIVPLLARTLSD